MKKCLIVLFLSFFLLSCGGEKGFKNGETVQVAERCIVAIDKDSFSEMCKYCSRNDEIGLEIMASQGLITILASGTSGVVTDMSFGKVKIRLNNGREYWCANEFICR